jgi:hypothetical protein
MGFELMWRIGAQRVDQSTHIAQTTMSDIQTGNQSGSPFDDGAEQEVIQQTGRTHADGSSYGTFTLTPASDTRRKELLCDARPIIPVIFLPGVMGFPPWNASR